MMNESKSPMSPFDEVVLEMRTYPSSIEVQVNGCRELSQLLSCMNIEDQFEYQNICQAILCAMQTHFENLQVQRGACLVLRQVMTALRSKSTTHDNYLQTYKMITSYSRLTKLLETMKCYSSSESIQRNGLRILRCILSIGAELSADTKLSKSNKRYCFSNILLQNKCLEIVIEAMWKHPHCSDVQKDGCIILWGLSFRSSTAQEIILRHDGVAAILNAMALYPKNAKLQADACGALQTLSFREDVCTYIFGNGGVRLLTQAITNHTYPSIDCINQVFTILVNITVSNEDFCILDEVDIIIISEVLAKFGNTVNGRSIRKMACYLLETAGKRHSKPSILKSLQVEHILSQS
jgi:hypothetical protein